MSATELILQSYGIITLVFLCSRTLYIMYTNKGSKQDKDSDSDSDSDSDYYHNYF